MNDNLIYKSDLRPYENLYNFCKVFGAMSYTLMPKTDERSFMYLDSPWKNEIGLQQFALDFQKSLFDNLPVWCAKLPQEEYTEELKKCQNQLRTEKHRVSAGFMSILVLNRVPYSTESPEIVKYDSLPTEMRLLITRCFDTYKAFLDSLEDSIKEEKIDFEHSQYILKGSPYKWVANKNNLSELILALFKSEAIQVTSKKLNRTVLARDLAAFFGVRDLHIDQDVEAMTYKTSSKTEFLELLKEKTEKYLSQRIDNQD